MDDSSWINFYNHLLKEHETIPDEEYEKHAIDGMTKEELLQHCRQQIIILKLKEETT